MVLFENYEEIAIGSFFKSKNETKEKVFNKSYGLVNIFVFLRVLSRSSVMFTRNFSKPLDIG